jgi:hypothetical protein
MTGHQYLFMENNSMTKRINTIVLFYLLSFVLLMDAVDKGLNRFLLINTSYGRDTI